MPLPFSSTVPKIVGGDGKTRADLNMDEYTALEEQHKFPNMSYLSAGNTGIVYIEGDKVIKYTDQEEIYTAKELFLNPIPCTVKIVRMPVCLGDRLCRIEAEKIEPLHENEKKWFLEFERVSLSKIEDPDIRSFIEKFQKLQNCLESNGYIHRDLHEENIGWSNSGELIVLDLGGMKKIRR